MYDMFMAYGLLTAINGIFFVYYYQRRQQRLRLSVVARPMTVLERRRTRR